MIKKDKHAEIVNVKKLSLDLSNRLETKILEVSVKFSYI